MNAYIDASVVLRVVLGEAHVLREWSSISRPISSRVLGVECLRALDRARLLGQVDDATLADRRRGLLDILSRIDVIPIDDDVLARAGEPFPVLVRTLDAVHLASAIGAREQVDDLVVATHDARLGLAASALGFEVVGLT